MDPRIAPRPGPREAEAAFLGDLRAASFRGDVHESDAHRTVASSDNSIWQQVPEAIVAGSLIAPPSTTHGDSIVDDLIIGGALNDPP